MPAVVWGCVTAGVWYAGANNATVSVFAVMTIVMCYLSTTEFNHEEANYE